MFDCLGKTSHDSGMRRKDIIRTYYAMEMFCENLGMYILATITDSFLDFMQLSLSFWHAICSILTCSVLFLRLPFLATLGLGVVTLKGVLHKSLETLLFL